MYSGTTLTNFSGKLLGAHQKFNSVARRHLTKMGVNKDEFPSIKRILHFEGNNGPDAIKRKSPAKDEPWHYIDPFDSKDTKLLEIIIDHYDKLVFDLKENNSTKSAFEAAWLAHAIVDGLTPAHHYPYEEKLVELRGGDGIHNRNTIKNKLLLPGDTPIKQMKNNWLMWGPKGLMTAHGLFEIGVATIVKPLTFSETVPTKDDIEYINRVGVLKKFQESAREIAVLDMYHHYLDRGWTPKLAWQIRHKLGPIMVQNISLVWYQALRDAGKIE